MNSIHNNCYNVQDPPAGNEATHKAVASSILGSIPEQSKSDTREKSLVSIATRRKIFVLLQVKNIGRQTERLK